MFLTNTKLPAYLEKALQPFQWSGIFSRDFKDGFVRAILAHNRQDVMPKFVESLKVLKFLDQTWVEEVSAALVRFAKEGFPQK